MSDQFQCLACDGIYFDASPEGGTYHHVCPDLPADKNGDVPVREDARNENVIPTLDGRTPELQAEGAGVKCLSNPKLNQPKWISVLDRRRDREAAAGR